MIQNRSFDLRDRGGIIFNEDDHAYFNGAGKQYESSTGLIKKYKAPFYETETAKYKAIKEVLPEAHFKALKKKAGGWDKVYTYWDALMQREWAEIIIERKDFHLAKWKHEAELGTIEHARRENEIKANGGIELHGVFYEYTDANVLDIKKDKPYCSTEMLVWDHAMELGGLVDLPLFNWPHIIIADYKTNKEIAREGFMNKKMNPPFGDLPDANFYHYSLQLNIYGDMIERLSGFKHTCSHIISTANKEYYRPVDQIIECADLKEHYLLLRALTIGE